MLGLNSCSDFLIFNYKLVFKKFKFTWQWYELAQVTQYLKVCWQCFCQKCKILLSSKCYGFIMFRVLWSSKVQDVEGVMEFNMLKDLYSSRVQGIHCVMEFNMLRICIILEFRLTYSSGYSMCYGVQDKSKWKPSTPWILNLLNYLLH